MILKFIGTNGSMGLVHGEKYNVTISSEGQYIYVTWQTKFEKVRCPYSSPQSFAANWEKV